MSLFILRYGLPNRLFQKLADISLDEVHLLEGTPAQGETLADLTSDDEVILCTSPEALLFRKGGLACKITLVAIEPRAVQRGIYWLLPAFSRRYHRVLTHDDYLMRRLKQAERWIHGGTLIDPDQVGAVTKTKRVSIIASKKRWARGHALRHRVIDWARDNNVDLDVFGGGYNWIDSKIDGHRPYCFSVVIENSSSPGYFSEQILDAMLCETVPIYWGAPDIGEFFEPEGIILCKNQNEITDALRRVQISDYPGFADVIARNKKKALESLHLEKCMRRILR
jgi:hypothetical protein